MKRLAGLERYHSHTIHRAYQDVFLNGLELEPSGSSSRFIEAVKQRCRAIEATYHEPRRPRYDSGSTAIRTPQPISRIGATPATDAFSRLQALGSLRGFFVAALPDSTFKVTLKVTIAGRGNVYRYGIIRGLDEVEPLIHRWIDKGVWTQDRQ